jgi:hypothetical protein
MASNLKRITSTGLICTGKCRLKSAVLQGGSANSTALIEDSTAGSGTVILGLAAVIGTSASWAAADPEGVFVSVGIYATLAGTGGTLSVEYD